jgi:hypothetical protein
MKAPLATFLAKATAAWKELPDWVAELALIADQRGLKGAGAAIGYSTSAVSYVLANSYTGDLRRVEEKVRGALMGLTVTCPVLGEIGRDQCLDHQRRPFAATNAIRTRLYHACRSGCPHSRLRKETT